MDFLKQWTLTISTTLIISIIFSVLSPKGNMGKYFKVILAMFIFVSFIYPLKEGNFDFSLPDFNMSEYEDMTATAYENTFTNYIDNVLNNGGYYSSKIDVRLNYSDNEIDIKSLEIGILDEFSKDDVQKYVFENTGFNAQVYYFGE